MKKMTRYTVAAATALVMAFGTANLAKASGVNAGNIKVFYCSANSQDACLKLNSEELQAFLEKYGCSLDNIQNIIIPPAVDTNPDYGSDSDDGNGDENQVPDNDVTEDQDEGNISYYEKRVAELVNEIRQENGLSPLALNSQLSMVARVKSQDMKDNGYFSHASPVYGSPFDMMKSFGISYRTAGENIAKGYSTPEAVVNAWMNSDGHRANILNPSFTQIGVGYVAEGNYWTQMFIG